jgi:hypothetical protein
LQVFLALFAGIALQADCERISEHTSHGFDLNQEAVMAKW